MASTSGEEEQLPVLGLLEERDEPSETDSDRLLFGSASELLAPYSRLC